MSVPKYNIKPCESARLYTYINPTDLKKEQWKQIGNTTYWCSTMGRFQNRKFSTPRPVMGYYNKRSERFGKDKKLVVKINGREKTAARLIWETFMGPIPKGWCVYHKDGLLDNNTLVNLDCVPPKECGKRTGGTNKKTLVVKDNKTGKVLKGTRAIGKWLGCSRQTVSDIYNGVRPMYPYDLTFIDRYSEGKHGVDDEI